MALVLAVLAVLAGCTTQESMVGPAALDGLRVSSLDGGRRHMCAITTVGSLECWGANSFGQTGDGNPYRQSTRPRPVSTLTQVSAVSAGGDFTCAIDDGGAPWCWGQNISGQLGNGARITLSLTPGKVLGGLDATQVTTGDFHTCVLEAGGEVSCWGLGTYGQIGDGARRDRYRPRRARTSGEATAVVAGGNHTCAILSEGGVECWGLNRFGQLGDGSRDDATVPQPVADLGRDAVQLAAGDDFTCARLAAGGVRCWGSNGSGQLGDGRRSDSSTPRAVVGIDTAVDLAAAGQHACVALADGEVRCWGTGESGQLGDHGTADRAVPVRAMPAHDARRVASTDAQSCSIDRAGRVTCWPTP